METLILIGKIIGIAAAYIGGLYLYGYFRSGVWYENKKYKKRK